MVVVAVVRLWSWDGGGCRHRSGGRGGRVVVVCLSWVLCRMVVVE